MARRRRRYGEPERHPTALGTLIPSIYPSKEPDDIKAIRAFLWWEKSVPARVSRNARPVRLSRGILWVHAATAVWSHELAFLKEQILASIQQNAPQAGVRDIRIKVGPLPPIPIRKERRSEPPPVVPVAQLPEDLARALAAVGDDGVRDVVQRAAAVSLAAPRNRNRDRDRDGDNP